MDETCYVSCKSARQQSIAVSNQCTQKVVVNEQVDGCKKSLSAPMTWRIKFADNLLLGLDNLPGRLDDHPMRRTVEKTWL